MNNKSSEFVFDPDMSEIEDINQSSPNYVSQRAHRLEKDQMREFKEEMRKLMMYFSNSQKEELVELKSALKDIRETNLNIENATTNLTLQNEEFKNKIISLESQVKEDRQYIIYLESKIEDLQSSSRKSNLEIKNVPKKDREEKQDLIDMTIKLTESIDCKITKSDIKDVYRVRGRNANQKNTPIVVELTSTLVKNDILKMMKSFNVKNRGKLCAKHLGMKSNEDTPIFLSEHLTAKGNRLHYLARDLKKSKGFKFCWTSYGRIYVRKTEQSQIIPITSEEQVQHLLQED